MKILWTSAIASTVFLTGTINEKAGAINLYNGTGLPGSQLTLQIGAIKSDGTAVSPFTGTGQTIVTGQGVKVDTAANSAEYSGYSNYNPSSSTYFNPAIFQSSTLNQATGYTITFTVSLDPSTLVDISTTAAPRAAFSVIAVSSDKKGIEIGFRPTAIFSQSASFGIEAETSLAINTSITRDYKLTVFNNTYSLASGGTSIINGNLQTYSFDQTASNPPLPFNPYTTSSFLFFGDDTGKASGTFTLGNVTLDTTPVPFEFSPTYGLLAIATGMAINNWRKKTKNK